MMGASEFWTAKIATAMRIKKAIHKKTFTVSTSSWHSLFSPSPLKV
jgi:hypothetical protein